MRIVPDSVTNKAVRYAPLVALLFKIIFIKKNELFGFYSDYIYLLIVFKDLALKADSLT